MLKINLLRLCRSTTAILPIGMQGNPEGVITLPSGSSKYLKYCLEQAVSVLSFHNFCFS